MKMGLSIITPHYNDFEGLKRIYACLKKQSLDSWEWLVVDDLSDEKTRALLTHFFEPLIGDQVQLILNTTKTNASVCRNIGMDCAHYERLVFLDADDAITEDFVAHRLIDVKEFVVFKNFTVVNEHDEHFVASADVSYPLDPFLKANFIWQTTSVLWNKTFLNSIGRFDVNLQRLQDVELSIRALYLGKVYKLIDNPIDFYYHTKPMRLRKHLVKESCASVNYLILKLYRDYTFNAQRHSLIKSYYYACVKNLSRSSDRADVTYVKESLNVFCKTSYINRFEYVVGRVLLQLYKYRLVSNSLFLKGNRYFFKEE
jgi:glycosyltransferase involved in cell wall biosynthesis